MIQVHVGSWHFFPFDGWRNGRSIQKGDKYAKGENDPNVWMFRIMTPVELAVALA
jgi:hypothetical protein